jgi:hypothetical protein
MNLFLGIALAKSPLKNGKSHQIAILDTSKYLARISKDDSIILCIYIFFIHDLQPDKWLKIPRQAYQKISNFHVDNCH